MSIMINVAAQNTADDTTHYYYTHYTINKPNFQLHRIEHPSR